MSIVRGSHLGMGSFSGRGLAQFTPFRQYPKEGEGHPKGLGTREKLPLRAFPRLLVKGGGPGLPGSLLLQAGAPALLPACPSLSLEGEGGNGLWSLFSVLLVALLCFSLLSLGREAPGPPGRRSLSVGASPALSSVLPCLSLSSQQRRPSCRHTSSSLFTVPASTLTP